jgi:hypothetical protein
VQIFNANCNIRCHKNPLAFIKYWHWNSSGVWN